MMVDNVYLFVSNLVWQFEAWSGETSVDSGSIPNVASSIDATAIMRERYPFAIIHRRGK